LPTDWQGCVVAIGVFDGVHLGHQRVVSRAVAAAAEREAPAVVVTVDPQPAEVLCPGRRPLLLTTTDRKAELVAELGVDGLCVLPSTMGLTRLSPEEIARVILRERLHAAAVVVGANFTFGYQAGGTVATLVELGERFDFTVVREDLVTTSTAARTEPVPVSSTIIRLRTEAGDVAAAAAMLGRPYRLEGVVVHGDARGSGLGYPTANFSVPASEAVPADGVYACWFRQGGGEPSRAAVSIGTNPTFAGRERRVEAYLLDESPDLYGVRVGVDFVARIRRMTRFRSAAELVRRMDADVAETRSLLGAP
jgi:riboflavin kinase/FMN adenylyltransferase